MSDPFIDTQFVSGTVITHNWLNGINDEVKNWVAFEALNPVSHNVNTIAALRLLDKTLYTTVLVRGYYSTGDGGGGNYWYDSTDTTSPDNGGTVVVGADGGRWKLIVNTTINVKQFGAIGDGVNDDTSSISAAIAAAKAKNWAVYAPSGRYRITSTIVIDYAIALFGDGGMGYSNPTPSSLTTSHQGTVFVSEVTTGYGISIAPSAFSFGCSLRNFSLIGKADGTSLHGLAIHNVGWTGSASDITIDHFSGTCLGINYIQDFHFSKVTLLRGGTTAANPLLTITSNANYVYFNNCHIEDASYLVKSSGGAWEVHFDDCHFECGDYGGALGPSHDHTYASAPILFSGNEYRWYFRDTTFVPVGVDSLVAANGGSRGTQPFFIDGAATSMQFIGCRWIAPTTAIDSIRITTDFGHNKMIGCSFENMNPIHSSIVWDDCTMSDCDFILYEGWNINTMWGPTINRGILKGCSWGNNPGGVAKAAGYAAFSNVDGGLKVYGNRFAFGTAPFKWLNTLCDLSNWDGVAAWKIYTVNSAFDMETIPPGTGLRTSTAGLTITDITNCQRGRRLLIFNDSGSGTINFNAGRVYPNGSANLTMAANSQYLFIADSTGMLVQVHG